MAYLYLFDQVFQASWCYICFCLAHIFKLHDDITLFVSPYFSNFMMVYQYLYHQVLQASWCYICICFTHITSSCFMMVCLYLFHPVFQASLRYNCICFTLFQASLWHICFCITKFFNLLYGCTSVFVSLILSSFMMVHLYLRHQVLQASW